MTGSEIVPTVIVCKNCKILSILVRNVEKLLSRTGLSKSDKHCFKYCILVHSVCLIMKTCTPVDALLPSKTPFVFSQCILRIYNNDNLVYLCHISTTVCKQCSFSIQQLQCGLILMCSNWPLAFFNQTKSQFFKNVLFCKHNNTFLIIFKGAKWTF